MAAQTAHPESNRPSAAARRRARAARSAERRGGNRMATGLVLLVLVAWIVQAGYARFLAPAPAAPAPIAITNIQHVPANDEHFASGETKLSYNITFNVNALQLDAARGEHLVISTTHRGETAVFPIAVGASYANISYLPVKGTDSQASVRVGVVDVNGTTTGYMTDSSVFTIPASQAP